MTNTKTKLPFRSYEGDEPYIFVSYAHKDSEAVFEIIGELNWRGYRVWYDEGIDPGTEWPEEIANHLERCETFLLFITPDAMESPNVRREINFALQSRKHLLSVYLKPTGLSPGMKMQLSLMQAIYYDSYDKAPDFYERMEKALADLKTEAAPAPLQSKRDPHPGPVPARRRAFPILFAAPLLTLLVGGGIYFLHGRSSGPVSSTPSKAAEELYSEGKGFYDAQEYVSAFDSFSKAAEQGDMDAQNNLGRMYQNGLGVQKDEAQAVSWYLKAAEQGDMNAQNNLGWMYENGLGAQKDEAQAVSWYLRAAEQGNANAQFNLGRFYAKGRDYDKAFPWYLKAAEQGNVNAQNNVGWMWANGLGTFRSDHNAALWYRKAAERGNANAQFNLGVFYENGLGGVPRDDAQAVFWYRKAAAQGQAAAQFQLGLRFENGLGVERNEEEAIFWYRKAAALGNEDARGKLELALGRKGPND
jgi:TPR repeat protein